MAGRRRRPAAISVSTTAGGTMPIVAGHSGSKPTRISACAAAAEPNRARIRAHHGCRRRDRRVEGVEQLAAPGDHDDRTVEAQPATAGRTARDPSTLPAEPRAAEVVVARAVSEQGVDASRRGIQPDGEPVQQDCAHAVVAFETGLDRRGSAEELARGEHPGHGIVGDPLTLETGARLGGDESETG